MPFPTQPTEDPLWASTGTVTVPTLAKRMTGWIFQEKPPFDFFNWYMFRVYEWIVFLRGYLNVDHDIVTGHHTVVYVQTRLDVESTSPIRYVLGVGVPSSRAMEFDLGSPDKGGWPAVVGAVGGAFTYNLAGTPPNTATSAGAQTATFAYNLDFLVGAEDDAVGEQWTLDRITLNRRANAAGDSVTVRLLSMAQSGVAATTVEVTNTPAVTGAGYASVNIAFGPLNVDPDRRYWVEVIITSNPASAAGEAGVAGVKIRANRLHLD